MTKASLFVSLLSCMALVAVWILWGFANDKTIGKMMAGTWGRTLFIVMQLQVAACAAGFALSMPPVNDPASIGEATAAWTADVPPGKAFADRAAEAGAAARERFAEAGAAAKERFAEAKERFAEAKERFAEAGAAAKERATEVGAAAREKVAEVGAAAKERLTEAGAAAREKLANAGAAAKEKAGAAVEKAGEAAKKTWSHTVDMLSPLLGFLFGLAAVCMAAWRWEDSDREKHRFRTAVGTLANVGLLCLIGYMLFGRY